MLDVDWSGLQGSGGAVLDVRLDPVFVAGAFSVAVVGAIAAGPSTLSLHSYLKRPLFASFVLIIILLIRETMVGFTYRLL